ncbi:MULTISPECIES: PTS N-acetylgalactosamine transporter subunit IIC [Enterobacteriaceae]|uniref:PTS N-acetylgalactosamine transporter subunit IIC n=1 Tax=Enterobacteriaceae TaxID=543 RepID=UPI0002729458|nr:MULTISPECIES: PTS N-acetylgalactosamine transporter subunit IIC [Enterobacteriaceae]AIR64915.1 PTS system N-acetylgalactosamine-specific transporter subunit IIC [Cedecea neteri]EJF32771.1 PTS system N-acetylgalactosamine-specific transporter subunit IIC [Enterobacter sp. Ag1]NIF49056.1 PTS mannose/fructose/sorbose/N-acetylgalactosamine transporter subunit IIC [Enterobacter sp. Ap-1006]NIG77168.1 PTS mannose/fructose/sorbose/N-acetylgalactosamine transporter subunit IIC [Klebsiella sp. Ap-873
MEISLLQAIALGLLAFIAGLDMFNGLTHMHRPVVLGPLVGLILGDLHTGILTGGTLELVWMGLAPLAGAQPPNVIIGTIVGTTFAITTGVKPEVAVGVAVPFAVAVQMGITFLFSVMSGVMARADRMAANADTNGIERINYLAMLALGIFYFLCAFLPIYFGAEHAKTAIDMLPARLIDGLGVAGGIMPAIGFAVLLKIMMKNVYIPYFIIGFVGAAWLKLPVLAIAAAALALALMDLMRKDPTPPQPARVQKEEFEDGI